MNLNANFASVSALVSVFLISSPVLINSFALPSAIRYESNGNNNTWVNNIQFLESWPIQSAGGCPLTVRPILLSNNTSYGDQSLRFGCGFFCYSNPCDVGYSFAVFFLIYKTNYTDPDDLQMVWTANREHLVHDNATLQVTSSGDLVLKDSDGSLVWSTDTSTQAFQRMMMEETGNLILLNSSNGTMWQSFDHPTDMLLPGQKLKVGQKLISNISPTNTSQGFYYGSLNVDGIALYTAPAPAQVYFRYHSNGSTSYIMLENESLNFYSEDNSSFSLPTPKNSLFVKIDSDGHLQFYFFQPKTGTSLIDYLSSFTNTLKMCEYPRVCGDYGICTDGQCSCPKEAHAFAPIDAYRPTLGCAPLTPMVCPETFSIQDFELLEIDHVSYFAYLYEKASTPRLVSRDECRNLCLKNCSCKAAFFRYDSSTSGYCYLESNVYSIKIDHPRDKFYNSTAYIKFQRNPKHPNHLVIVICIAVGAGLFVLFLSLGFWVLKYGKWRREEKRDELEDEDELEDGDEKWPAGLTLRFSFEELEKATNNFRRKLGSGGFGTVYEGLLTDGSKIAVKRLDRAGQGTKQFKAEVETVGSIHHLNLVRLKGFCAEKSHRMLVYEYLPNGSLDKWIFPHVTDQFVLDWNTRSKVVLHIARGLAYLHEECEHRIIHFDIKPQNILLDENFNAKVSDFGLAKLTNREQSEVITMLRGTPGYMAPELLSFHISEKADVFSFGVVLVEIVSGKRSRQICGHRLFSVLQRKAEEGRLKDLLDSRLKYEVDVVREEAEKMLRVGMLCVQDDFMSRPAMSIVVKALEGMTELESFPCSSSPAKQHSFLPSYESPHLEFSYTAESSGLSGR